MAITKVGTYRNPPEDITDYEAIVAHLNAYTRQIGNQGMILTEWTNNTTAPKIAMGSYISHGGVLYVVDTEDYALPALSSDGTYYLRVAASGDTLAITYTTNIADYSWNAVYGGLYHADESQVLPYQVVKNTGASTITKYKMLNPWQVDDFAVVNYLGVYHGRGLSVTGAISGASLAVTGNATVGGTLNGANITNFPRASILTSFASPSTTPTGLTFDGTNLISCDSASARIYIHDGISASILTSFASPSTTPRGLAFDGTNLISCDVSTGKVYIHDGVSSTILSSFVIPSVNPTGLTFDGTNLISCNSTNDMIYIHDGITSSILSSFASPSSNPTGLTFDGTNLISCDSNTARIYIYDGISASILTSFASPSTTPTGLTFDGTNLISCDSTTARIYIHRWELRFLY